MTHAKILSRYSLALLGILLPALPGSAYIDGGGRADHAPGDHPRVSHGNARPKSRKPIRPAAPSDSRSSNPSRESWRPREIKLQLSWEGAAPKAIQSLKPGQTAVHFTVCYDKRSLTYIDDLWAWTQPAQDGWGTARSAPTSSGSSSEKRRIWPTPSRSFFGVRTSSRAVVGATIPRRRSGSATP